MDLYRSRRRRASQARPPYHTAERLEARTLFATFLVTNTANTGDGSLRNAIRDANDAAAAHRRDVVRRLRTKVRRQRQSRERRVEDSTPRGKCPVLALEKL